jgi:hypothetical protein
VNQRPKETPLLQDLRHAVDRVALADPAQVESDVRSERANFEVVRAELEALEPGAPGDIEGAAGHAEEDPRGRQAVEGEGIDERLLPCAKVVDARNVAVRDKAAQELLEPVREAEGGGRACRAYSGSW